MSLTTEQRREAGRELAKELFQKTGATATLNLDDILAAIGSLDDAMDTIISTIPGAWQSKTIKQALIDNLPEPFQSASTSQQKALALSLWAMKESGLI